MLGYGSRRGAVKDKIKMAGSTHLCATEIFGSFGGIQTYMRLLAESLRRAQKSGVDFSLLDAAASPRLASRPCVAAGGSRIKLVRELLRWVDVDDTIVFGHLNLAPLGLALKTTGRIEDYVIVLHGIEAWRRLSPLRTLALRQAGRIIATTPFTLDEVRRLNPLGPVKGELLPLALEPHRFELNQQAGSFSRSEGPLRLLSLTRLDKTERDKGIHWVLEALARLDDSEFSFQYTIVGDGDDRGRLQRMANDLGLEEQVEFTGSVSDAVLKDHFYAADVFVLPSRKEGFGLVYLEAMAHGLPLIACRAGGVPFVVDDGVTGILVEYGEVGEIVSAIQTFADEQRREDFAHNALRQASSRYAFSRFHRDFHRILDNLSAEPANL